MDAEIEARRRAQQRWRKVKHGIIAQQAFSQAGKTARERRLATEQTGTSGGGASALGAASRARKSAKVAPTDTGGSGRKSEREWEEELVRNTKARMGKGGGSGKGFVGRRLASSTSGHGSNPSEVTENIVVGNREAAQDALKLQDIGVTHVLNICSQLPNYHPNKFVYCKVDILDDPSVPISNYQKKSSKFLSRVEELGGKVLVHCVAGCSRSVSIVILHLMAHHNVVLRDAWDHLRRTRPQMNPNPGFKLQLAKFEIDRFGASSMVTCRDKFWDFYEWNAIKTSVPQMKSQASQQTASCIIL